ncbi:unnamed protein product [Sphagnum jensenii]|uniref:Uncharacterized protein n=1 Tax=Sphagnum jensenii TaxID=128206 RepID=A0ABP1BWX3_9BRYO
MNSRETAGKKKKSLKEKLEEEADKKGKQQQVWGEVVEEEKADFWQFLGGPKGIDGFPNGHPNFNDSHSSLLMDFPRGILVIEMLSASL